MESTQPFLRCSYSYDPLDRLISQLQPDAPAHPRFYCKSRLTTEIQGAIGFSVFQNTDLLLAQHKNQGGAVESTLLATDLQRSVLHTLTTDQQQHPIAYSPYGHRQAESGLTSLLGFNGERPDPVTGYYLLGNGYRAFNPTLMRFNSPDSWSPFGDGGFNAYAYCLGEPVLGSDPTGHSSIFLSAWKGFKNLFGRIPRKFRAPTSAFTHNTVDLTKTPASINEARKSGISSLSTQSAQNANPPRLRSALLKNARMKTFENNPQTAIKKTKSPPNNAQPQNNITSLNKPKTQNTSRASREELELDLELAHDRWSMEAYIAGDRQALNRPFNLSDHADYLRKKGF